MIVHPRPVSNPAHTTISIRKVLKRRSRRPAAKKRAPWRALFVHPGGCLDHQQFNCHHPGPGASRCPVPTASHIRLKEARAYDRYARH